MKTSRLGKFSVAAVIATVGGYLGSTYLHRPQPSFKEASALLQSVHAFVETRRPPLPASVQLPELIEGGYITPDTARRFVGSEITLPRRPSGPESLERASERVLISLRLFDGRETVMTADGSIRALPR